MLRQWMFNLPVLAALLLGAFFVSAPQAHAATFTWANSNITATPPSPLDWFSGGPNTQATWTGGDPVSNNTNTIEFFQDTTTLLTYTGNPSTQVSNLNNGGSPFELGSLTLNGRANTASNAKLTMTLSGDALNFSGATGTINLNAVTLDSARHITYNVNNAIRLGTVSSGSVLTLTGNGTLGNAGNNGAFNIGGAITELMAGGGTIVKSGSSHVNVSSAGNSFSGPINISGGRLTFVNTGAWGGTGKNVNFTGSAQLSSTADGYAGGTLTVSPGVTATLGGGDAGVGTGSLSFVTTTGAGSVSYATSASKNLNLGNASGLTGNLTARLRANANYNTATTIQFSSLSDAVGSKLQFIGGTSDSNQALTVTFSGGSAPLVFDDRQIQALPRISSNHSPRFAGLSNNSSLANTWTINTDLDWRFNTNVSLTNKELRLGGSNAGDNAFNGLLSEGVSSDRLNLSKIDAGKWILGHTANTYTGFTDVRAGTLEIKSVADGGVASSIGLSSNAAANLVIQRGATLRYTGSGHSTDRLFTTLNPSNAAGTYALDSSGTGPIQFTNSGTIVHTGNFTGTRTLLLTGTNTGNNTFAPSYTNFIFSGTQLGAINKSDVGTWVLSGANTYTGITTINAGILQFANQASLYNNTPASWTAANINVKSTGTLAFNVGGVGEFTAGDITTLLTNLANSTSATNGMNAGSAFGFDTTNAAGGTFTIGDVIANSGGISGGARGLTKLGTGTLVLTNANTYTGPTTVNDGELLVNGSLAAGSAVTVNSGATLGGTGTVNGTVNINAGGFLAPGNSIGTMNVGPLTISGTENMELGLPGTVPSPGLSDRTNVTGALTLNGGSTLNLIDNGGNDGNGSLGAGRYQLMTYTTTLSGTFTNVTGLPSTHVANVIYSGPGIAAADGVLLDLFDHGQASITGMSVIMNTSTDFTFDFGIVGQNSAQTAALLLENLINTLGFTAGIDLDSLAETGDDAALATGTFTNDLGSPIANLGAGANSAFNIGFDTSTLGVFTADYVFTLSDVNGLLGSGSLPTLTLHVLGEVQAVPEPAAVAVWSVIGLCLAGVGVRRYRRKK